VFGVQARGNIDALYPSDGVLGSMGLGCDYIRPVTTLVKWFPDKRGTITAIAGAGAFISAPIAERLISSVGVSEIFAILGLIYLVAVTGATLFTKSPPEAQWQPPSTEQKQCPASDYTLKALRTWQWYAPRLNVVLSTIIGISIISRASPRVSRYRTSRQLLYTR